MMMLFLFNYLVLTLLQIFSFSWYANEIKEQVASFPFLNTKTIVNNF